MNRKWTPLVGAVAAGLLLLTTACSSGSGGNAGSQDKQGSEAAPPGVATSVVRQFDDQNCDDAKAAYAAIADKVDGDASALDSSQKEPMEEQLGELQSLLPAQLDGDMTVMSIAFQVYFSTTADMAPDAAERQGAAEGLRSDAVRQARANIEAFFEERCGGSA